MTTMYMNTRHSGIVSKSASMRGLIGAAAFAAGILGGVPAALANATYSDGTFNPIDWTSIKVIDTTFGSTATFSTTQQNSGGNPGDYREQTHVYQFGEIQVAHMCNYATVNPSQRGAIQDVYFSYDLITLSAALNGMEFTPLLEQGGLYYEYVPRDAALQPTWTSFSDPFLVQTDFTLIGTNGTGPNPNFSNSGTTITFGYLTRDVNTNPGTVFFNTAGIDNWFVDIHCVPEPTSLALLACGGLAFFRRR